MKFAEGRPDPSMRTAPGAAGTPGAVETCVGWARSGKAAKNALETTVGWGSHGDGSLVVRPWSATNRASVRLPGPDVP